MTFSLFPAPASAETRVSGLIGSDTVWSAAGSPYLLTGDATIPDNVTLTAEPGTIIRAAPESAADDEYSPPVLYVSGGAFHAAGSGNKRVSIEGIGGIYITAGSSGNGSADIRGTDFRGGASVSFDGAHGIIASSSISGAAIAVYMKDSAVSIWGSHIKDNEVGIRVQPHQAFQVLNDPDAPAFMRRFGRGGEGNALAQAAAPTASSSLTIRSSSLSGNTSMSIGNFAEFIPDARDNWWGSPGGPAQTGANRLRGNVETTPWLTQEPPLETAAGTPACCSSVLFIPGFEGSRLYKPEQAPLGIASTNQLWEPNRNADASKLAMNAHGSTTDPSIYSGSPIGKALGFVGIYDGLMRFMDALVGDGKIGEWRAFGYDWRKPIAEVVAGPEQKATSTESLVGILADMAARSRTGKVSVVAHSNGGLVAKYLVKALQDAGKAGLIDTVVSVAVPYLGTPQAIAGLLHGDDQALAGGLIMNKATARAMGSNMPSVYSLLPSREFFSTVFLPSIAFASTALPGLNMHDYPLAVTDADSQGAFIADAASRRRAPAASDTKSPLKGNALLMAAASVLHGVLDPFVWPTAIARWAVVGWNATTTSGILYTSASSHELLKSRAGDGTVLAPSAYHDSGLPLSVDLRAQSQTDGFGLSHANILESSTVQSALASILSNPADESYKVQAELDALPGAHIGEIDWEHIMADEAGSRKELRISTHSPVKLHVYDSEGNHTGEVPLPPEAAAQVEEGLYTMKEENIPGSTYDVPGCDGDDDCDTTITVPDTADRYAIVVEGTGVGTFTLDIDRVRGTSTVERLEWSGVPTAPSAVATTTIIGDDADAVAASSSLAHSSRPLTVDMDGDGRAEMSTKAGRAGNASERRDFLKRYLDFFRQHRGHLAPRQLTPADHKRITGAFREYLKRFGQ